MKNAEYYISAIKAKHNLPSDYAVAKFLGVTRQAISQVKKGGGFDDYTSLKVAEALDIDPLEVIASSNAMKAKSEEEEKAWKKIMKKVSATAAGIALPFITTAGLMGEALTRCILC